MTLAEEIEREMAEIRKHINRLWLAAIKVEKLVGVRVEVVN